MTPGIGEGWGIRKVSVPRVKTIKWLKFAPSEADLAQHALEHAGASISERPGWFFPTVWHITWPQTEKGQ